MKRATKPLSDGPSWTFDDIRAYMDVLGELAESEFGLDTYSNQIEIVSSEQMLDAYAFNGLPSCYHHWRYGKHYSQTQGAYQKGLTNLAYELVINSSPAISYFMEENNLVTQALVAAHACFGHNAFFKNNFLFKEWTQADAIVDYAIFAKNYIAECEDRYGWQKVEETLDAAHTIEHHGIDKYKRPPKLSAAEEKELQKTRMLEREKDINYLWNMVPGREEKTQEESNKFPSEPEENVLYFMEKHSPILETWQREILRIVRKLSQYFYPQSQTKVMNEGYASFWHYTLLYRLWELGYLTDGFMQSFLNLHTAVVRQPNYNECGGLSGLNPYYLGFYSFKEIRRICEEPTEEDGAFFPQFAGNKETWVSEIHKAAYEFKDESFILQYLSPALMRQMRMFTLLDDSGEEYFEVAAISNDDGYRTMRSILSKIYNRAYQVPDITVIEADIKGDRTLTLHHSGVDEMPLEEKSKTEVLKHIKVLWGFDVKITSDAKPSRPFDEDDYYVWI
jgi:stage V sporulation protein R